MERALETVTTQCPTTSNQHKGVRGKYWANISRSTSDTYAQGLARDIIPNGEGRARIGLHDYRLEAIIAAL